ncbi:aldose 1-epimerase [Maribacter halichondriae]|uniref:aldose epimerase family protein n=1 Tax=Maribacter halichondriae TaxID=2980554 RepID=UPI00235987B3|nr:aldose 1-epimerase [Maribacter sp. Hal144]
MVLLQKNGQSVKVDKGELVGYQVEDHEFIHQKGSPGWRNSDTEMFPIIGPTAEADFKVHTPKGEAIQDQHGLLRELEYELLESTEALAVFSKKYKSGTPVANSKFPTKSTAKTLFWPYDFSFTKRFELFEDALEISFEIEGDLGMPFMLGYHPAFKLYGEDASVVAGDRSISLAEVLAVGSRALQVPDCSGILLKDKKQLKISTSGFGNFMLWTEVSNMVCIEPITFYPYSVSQENLNQGFQKLETAKAEFKVVITPK